MKHNKPYDIPEDKMTICLKLVSICCIIVETNNETNIQKALPQAFQLFDSFLNNHKVKETKLDKLQSIKGSQRGVLHMTAKGKFKYFIKHIRNAICHYGIKWNPHYVYLIDKINDKQKTAIGSLDTFDFERFLNYVISDYEHSINK